VRKLVIVTSVQPSASLVHNITVICKVWFINSLGCLRRQPPSAFGTWISVFPQLLVVISSEVIGRVG